MIHAALIHGKISQAIRRTNQKPIGFTHRNVQEGAKRLAEVYKAAAEVRALKTIQKSKVMQVYTEIVCEYFGLPVEKVVAIGRKRPIVKCRQIICYLAKMEGVTLCDMGEYFGQDHTSCLHSIQTVKDLLATDEAYRAQVRDIENLLR
jgi:chromosomal replication initiation ATPase DnaA